MNFRRTRNTWLTLLVIIGLVLFQYFYPADVELTPSEETVEAGGVVQAAYDARRSGVWLETEGEVTRLLADDNEGSRHQRFIMDVGGGHTVLIAHNIDLAERVPIRQGDSVSLRGRYEWNDRGGVIHWTHHDPDGRLKGGWIRSQGELFK